MAKLHCIMVSTAARYSGQNEVVCAIMWEFAAPKYSLQRK
jgi:hypothetical protein